MTGTPWYEDTEFWESFGPLMFDRDRREDAVSEVEGLLTLARPPAGAALLDACCGPGRHALELAARGYAVTGVDLMPSHLARAESEARRRGLAAEFLRADAGRFRRAGAFAGVLNLFQSIGYTDDPDDDLRMLENLRTNLAPGGFLAVEMTGKEVWARDFEERVWFERDGRTVLLEYRTDLNWTRLINRWIFWENGIRRERTFSYRLFSARELAGMLADAGFGIIDIYGDFDGRPYDHKARRLLAIAWNTEADQSAMT